MPRKDDEPRQDNQEPKVFAPDGTFEFLQGLPDGKLGNAYTKRVVRVTELPGFQALLVSVRVSDDMSTSRIYRSYDFVITEDEQVSGSKAKRFKNEYHSKRRKIKVPPVEDVLGEIREAVKIQPKLKPQR